VDAQRESRSGLPERSQEHVVRHVFGHTTCNSESTSHLTHLWIERVHEHADLRESIPDDRRDRKTIRTGQELVDHQNLRYKVSAKFDALASVLRDANAFHVRFGVDQVAQVLAN